MILNLQLLRAIAAFMVFYHHFTPNLKAAFPAAKAYEFGAAGVDIFFVLSGFIMVVTTSARPTNPLQFFANRVVRIVPIYWVMTSILVVLFLAGFRPLGLLELRDAYIWKSLLFIPFLRGGNWEPILSVGWTLNYEMFFYAIFGMMLLMPSLRGRIVALICVLIAIVTLGPTISSNEYVLYYSSPIILDFVFGATFGGAYVTWLRGRPFQHAVLLSWSMLTLAVAIIAVTATGYNLYSNSLMRPLTWGVAGLLMVSACVLLETHGRSLKAPWLIALGNASYSIYLIHNLMIQTSAKLAAALGLNGWAGIVVTALVAISSTILFGLASYRYLEEPINRRFRGLTGKPSLRQPSPSAS